CGSIANFRTCFGCLSGGGGWPTSAGSLPAARASSPRRGPCGRSCLRPWTRCRCERDGHTGVYVLLTVPFRRIGPAIAIGSGACLTATFHLQITTAIGLLGIAAWAAYDLAMVRRRLDVSRRATRVL